MVRVTFWHDDDESTTVETRWTSSQVDAEVQRLLSAPGNELELDGQRIAKDFRGYSFDE